MRFDSVRAGEADDAPKRETLVWVADVQRVGSWYIIAEVMFASTPLMVQATTYGCHVTAPSRGASSRWEVAGHLLSLDGGRLSREHRWELTRDGSRAVLRLDGDVLWGGDVPGAMTGIAFGETRSDREHGGALRLTVVEYTADHE